MSDRRVDKVGPDVILNAIRVLTRRDRLCDVDYLTPQQIERVRKFLKDVLKCEKDILDEPVDNPLHLLEGDEDR